MCYDCKCVYTRRGHAECHATGVIVYASLTVLFLTWTLLDAVYRSWAGSLRLNPDYHLAASIVQIVMSQILVVFLLVLVLWQPSPSDNAKQYTTVANAPTLEEIEQIEGRTNSDDPIAL